MSGHRKWRDIEYRGDVAEGTATIEFSCSPFAPLALDGHADAIDGILDSLEADPRALGVGGVGFDDKFGRVSTTSRSSSQAVSATPSRPPRRSSTRRASRRGRRCQHDRRHRRPRRA